MAVTAYRFPTASGAIDSEYTNPHRAYADDAAAVSAYTSAGHSKQDWHTFGLTSSHIPTDATIVGIEIEIEAKMRFALGAETRSEVCMVKGGAKVGTSPTCDWSSTSFVKQTLGGAADLWGTSWTQADIVASGFGVWFECSALVGVSPDTWTHIDYVTIRVYWHLEHTTSVSISMSATTPKSISRASEVSVSIAPPITDTGWRSPSGNGAIDVEWTSPWNAYVSNNTYSEGNGTGTSYDQHDYYGFGFNLHPSDTIVGIEVGIEGKITGMSSVRASIYMVKAGAKVGTPINVTFSTTSDTYKYAGGNDSMWGTTWTPAEVNASAFGVHINLGTLSGSGDTYIDHVQLKIYLKGGRTASITVPVIASISILASVPKTITRVASVVLSMLAWIPRNLFNVPSVQYGGDNEKDIASDDGTEKAIDTSDGTEKGITL